MAEPHPIDISLVFIELGIVIIGLALLARLASRCAFSAMPLYLLAGLAFGNGGLLPLQFSKDFVHLGAEIGVILLLFLLGLEYSDEQLGTNLPSGLPAGLLDFILNFPPGLIAGFYWDGVRWRLYSWVALLIFHPPA
jgi:monovalent cation:H+ antiporter-2, CPA2 family